MTVTSRVPIISFLVALLLVFALVAWILKPFVNILAFALIMAVLFHPVYKLFLGKVKKASLASLLTIVVILSLIALPLWLFGQLIFAEIAQLFEKYKSGYFVFDQNQIISDLPVQVQDFLTKFNQDISNWIGQFSSKAFSSLTAVLSNVAGFIVAFFMFIFIVYYLLKDGHKIKQALMDISPMASKQENILVEKIVTAVNGVVKGSFMVALIQGVVATIGFLIFGIPEPFLWGAFTVVAALVPNVGTSIALVPAVIYLAVTGHSSQAIGLAIWGAVAVGLVDNFIGPKLVGGSTKLHPVLVLLSVIGGIQFFGILGFLIGPIIMAVFVAMVEMYRTEFKNYLTVD